MPGLCKCQTGVLEPADPTDPEDPSGWATSERHGAQPSFWAVPMACDAPPTIPELKTDNVHGKSEVWVGRGRLAIRNKLDQ